MNQAIFAGLILTILQEMGPVIIPTPQKGKLRL